MNVLDQILLLEQKVESAVAKISQLQAENDALRTQCAELTNALSAKTELLTHFEHDQGMIENGILKALDRLASIENSVLQAAGASAAQIVGASQTENTADASPAAAAPLQETPNTESVQEPVPPHEAQQTPAGSESAAQAPENTPSGEANVAEAAPQATLAGESVPDSAVPHPETQAQTEQTSAQGGEGTPHNPEQAQNPVPENGQFDIF